jgi:hypothetical protein
VPPKNNNPPGINREGSFQGKKGSFSGDELVKNGHSGFVILEGLVLDERFFLQGNIRD